MVRAAGIHEAARVADAAGVIARSELARPAYNQRARGNAGRSRVGVHSREGQESCGILGKVAATADHAIEALLGRAAIHQGARVDDIPRVASPAEAAGAADGDGSGIDCGVARVGVVPREGERAAGVFDERTRAADHAAEGLVVRAAVNKGAAVGDIPRVVAPTQPASRCDFKNSGADRGGARVGAVAGERECAAAVFRERTGAADRAGEGLVVRSRENQHAAVGDRTGVASPTQPPGGSDFECSRIDRRVAAVAVVAREGQNV